MNMSTHAFNSVIWNIDVMYVVDMLMRDFNVYMCVCTVSVCVKLKSFCQIIGEELIPDAEYYGST